MSEDRKLHSETIMLEGWAHRDLPLSVLRDRVDALLAEHGPESFIYVGGEGPEVELTSVRPETDEEMSHRLIIEEAKVRRIELRRELWNKLTPVERAALQFNSI